MTVMKANLVAALGVSLGVLTCLGVPEAGAAPPRAVPIVRPPASFPRPPAAYRRGMPSIHPVQVFPLGFLPIRSLAGSPFGPFFPVRLAPNSQSVVNPNWLVAPGVTLQQAAYNI